MIERFLTWWREFWTSKEVALLRHENQLLHDANETLDYENAILARDNRALVNAQLKQAGVITLPDIEAKPEPIKRIHRFSLHQRQRQHAAATDPRRVMEENHGS